MRIIKYYDRIHKRYIDLEVTDEVAKFLQCSKKQEERQRKKSLIHNVSLNKVLYNDYDNTPITLEDVLPDETEKEIEEFCAKCFRNQHLYRLVWKSVDKLNVEEQKLIEDIYIKNKSQREIAEKLGTSESNISQAKERMLVHFSMQLNTDEEFRQTDLYKRVKRDFEYSFIKVLESMVTPQGLQIDLNKTFELTKTITQTLKSLTTQDINLGSSENEKQEASKQNKVVKHTLEDLNLDFSKQNFLTLPFEFFKNFNTENFDGNKPNNK